MNGRGRFTISRRQIRLGNGLLLASLLWVLPAWWFETILRETLSGRFLLLTAPPFFALVIAGAVILRRAWKCPKCERLIHIQSIPRSWERGGVFYCPHCGAQLEVQ